MPSESRISQTRNEVGGKDAPIVVIAREAGSVTRDGFESITDTEDKCRYRQDLTSTGDVLTTVVSNPDEIGYASRSIKVAQKKPAAPVLIPFSGSDVNT